MALQYLSILCDLHTVALSVSIHNVVPCLCHPGTHSVEIVIGDVLVIQGLQHIHGLLALAIQLQDRGTVSIR